QGGRRDPADRRRPGPGDHRPPGSLRRVISVLMDLSMPRMGGVEATRRLLADHPGLQVVVLTSFSDQEQVLDAVDAGAVGYLLKDADPTDLVDGGRAAAGGQSAPHPQGDRRPLS